METLDLMNKRPIIEFSEASIMNGKNLILSDVSLNIKKGEFMYIIGKVGSGKTSIIKALIGELPVKEGDARIFNYDLKKLKKKEIPYLRRNIGVVFQDFQLLMDRTIYDNLSFVLRSTGWKERKKIKSKIEIVLSDVGMLKKAHKMPHQLSGGEQQRIAIARALLNDPEIILADEPTGNLDNDTATEIMELLMDIHRSQKPAILMVTHNHNLFKSYPARTIICEDSTCKELGISETTGIEIDFTDIF